MKWLVLLLLALPACKQKTAPVETTDTVPACENTQGSASEKNKHCNGSTTQSVQNVQNVQSTTPASTTSTIAPSGAAMSLAAPMVSAAPSASPSPVVVATTSTVAPMNAVAIAAGDSHTCAALTDGSVVCWGDDSYYQLGDGQASGLYSATPVKVPGLSHAVAVYAAGRYSCAMTDTNTVWCWGQDQGQMGQNSTGTRTSPVQAATNVTAFSAGATHACKVSGGTVYCSGLNDYGELGTGGYANLTTFTPVAGIGSVSSVAAGTHHTCMLSSGSVYCVGRNNEGELGNGSYASSTAPVLTSGLGSVTAITAGLNFTCALRPSGYVSCYGSNANGALGIASLIAYTANASTVVGVGNSGYLTGATAVAAGGGHACVLTAGGGVACYGLGSSGQLGTGSTASATYPVSVNGLTSGVVAVATGGAHSCVVLSSGQVQCFGSNANSQLGDGTSIDRYNATVVKGF